MKKRAQINGTPSKAERKKRMERRYTIVAISITVLIVLGVVAITVGSVVRSALGDSYVKGFMDVDWYSEDGLRCWTFSTDDTGSKYVYMFGRSDLEKTYTPQARVAFRLNERERTVSIYFKQDTPTVYKYTIKEGSLQLSNGEEKLKFKMDDDLVVINLLIEGKTGSPFEKKDLTTGWILSNGLERWQFEENEVLIYERENEKDPFAFRERLPYLADGEKGNISVEHKDGEQTVYACTIASTTLTLVSSDKGMVFAKE